MRPRCVHLSEDTLDGIEDERDPDEHEYHARPRGEQLASGLRSEGIVAARVDRADRDRP